MANFAVDTSGIGDLVRDLRKLSRAFALDVTRELRTIGLGVAAESRARAPRRSGRLARSIRPSVRRGQISIFSDVPYAPVHEFGGTIRPKGTPIRIQGRRYMGGAVDSQARDVEDKLGDLLELAARRHAEFR